jgi:hypothetical protein
MTVTLADRCALLAFDAALDGDITRWRAYGSLADRLDRPGDGPISIIYSADGAITIRLEAPSYTKCHDGAATDEAIN